MVNQRKQVGNVARVVPDRGIQIPVKLMHGEFVLPVRRRALADVVFPFAGSQLDPVTLLGGPVRKTIGMAPLVRGGSVGVG